MSSLPSSSHVPVITKKRRTIIAKDMISQPLLAISTTLFAHEGSHAEALAERRRSGDRSRVSFDTPAQRPVHRRRGSEPAIGASVVKDNENRQSKSRIAKTQPTRNVLRKSIIRKGKKSDSTSAISDERNGDAERLLYMDALPGLVNSPPFSANGSSQWGNSPLRMALSPAGSHFRMDEFGSKVPDAPENVDDAWSDSETHTEDQALSRPQSGPIHSRLSRAKSGPTLPLAIRRRTNPTGSTNDLHIRGQSSTSLTSLTLTSRQPLVESPSAYPMTDYFSKPDDSDAPLSIRRCDSFEEEATGSDRSLLELSESLAHLNVASLEEEVLSMLHPKDPISPFPEEPRDLEFDSFIAFDDPSMEMEDELPFDGHKVLPESPMILGRYRNNSNATQEANKFGTFPSSKTHGSPSLYSHTNSSFSSLLSRFPVYVHEEPRPRSLLPKKRYTKRRNGVSIADYFDYAHLASQVSTPDQSFRVLEPEYIERDVEGSKLRSMFED